MCCGRIWPSSYVVDGLCMAILMKHMHTTGKVAFHMNLETDDVARLLMQPLKDVWIDILGVLLLRRPLGLRCRPIKIFIRKLIRCFHFLKPLGEHHVCQHCLNRWWGNRQPRSDLL